MKLQLKMDDLILNGPMTETDVSVGDPRIIIHHLVKSVYQFPKITMVQEIASNAKDANVESGKADVPVEIKVPSRFDPTLVISDHGIGISPVRMFDIFIKIGNSTKRETNDADGAFGIGSKIPLAYCDQFTVKTVTIENAMLVRRLYAVVRKDDFSLKLVTIGEPHYVNSTDDASDQHTGTCITIPIKPDDVAEVRQAVLDKTEFWKVRPILTGADPSELKYPTRNWFYQCDEFSFALDSNDRYNHDSGVEAVINGVRYPLSAARHSGTGVNYPYFSGKIYLNFNVGELTPALNREALQYDEPTKKKLLARIESAIAIIKKNIADIIESQPTFLTAWDKMTAFKNSQWTDKNFTWHGLKLNENIRIPTVHDPVNNVHRIPKDAPVTMLRFFYNNGKMCNKSCDYFGIEHVANLLKENIKIIYTERKTISHYAVREYLQKDCKNAGGNTIIVLRGQKSNIDKFLTDNNIGEVIANNLFNLDSTGYCAPPRGHGPSAPRQKSWKIINKWRSTGKWRNSMETWGTFRYDDVNDCGYYYIYQRDRGSDHLNVGNDKTIDYRDMYIIQEALKISIVGVAPGNVKYLNTTQWKPLCDLFKGKNNEDIKTIISEYQEYIAREKVTSHSAFNITQAKKLVDRIAKKSPVTKWVDAVEALPKNKAPVSNRVTLSENLISHLVNAGIIKDIQKFKDHPIVELYNNAHAAYPLLKHVGNSDEKTIDALVDYIKLVDKN